VLIASFCAPLTLLSFLHAECYTSYEHCYFIKDNMRTYYKGIPDVIEVGEHQFVECEVLNLFAGLMLLSW
jgi:hypothetical protein